MQSTFIIRDIIKKNISDNFDILIYNPDFLQINLENAKVYLYGNHVDNTDNKLDLLDGLEYEILFSGSYVYQNIFKSGVNIFSKSNIPFSFNVFHKGFFIIYNLPNELVKKIYNYTLVIEYNLSIENFQHNDGYTMDWDSGINETHLGINQFRFIGGMCGVSHNTSNNSGYISDNYYNQNHKIIAHDEDYELNNYICLHLANLDESNNWVNGYESECNIYSIKKMLMMLIEKKIPNLLTGYETVSDNFKIPIWSGDFVKIDNYDVQDDTLNVLSNDKTMKSNMFKYTFNDYSKPDAISNIEFLCSNKKYIIKIIKIILCEQKKIINDNVNNVNNFIINNHNNLNQVDYEDIYHKFDLEFDSTPNGYKILGLSNFLIIPTICSSNTKIEIEFELGNENISNVNNLDNLFDLNQIDFWLRYDRFCIDASPRRMLAQTFIIGDEEYPIVDLTEYLTKKKTNHNPNDIQWINLHQNPVQHQILNNNFNQILNNNPNQILNNNPNQIQDFYQNDNNIFPEQNEIKYLKKFSKIKNFFKYYKIVTESIIYLFIIMYILSGYLN